MRVRLLTCFAFLSLLAVAAAQTDSLPYPPQDLLNRIQPEGIHAHMNYLADDLLEGRGTGTRGYMLAAKYVAAQFEEMGLKPAGDNGTYYQNVHFRRIERVDAECSMSLTRNGKEQALVWEKDFVTAGNYLKTENSVSAPLVFVGYGVSAPEFHYDDYAGVDVKGKIAVVLPGAPASFPNAPRAYYPSTYVRRRTAVDHGAVGVIWIWAGAYADRRPFERVIRSFREPDLRWLDAQGIPNDAVPGASVSAIINRDVASTLFESANKSFQQVLDN